MNASRGLCIRLSMSWRRRVFRFRLAWFIVSLLVLFQDVALALTFLAVFTFLAVLNGEIILFLASPKGEMVW